MKSLFLISIIISLVIPIGAQGATYYVTKTGDDAFSCSQIQSLDTPKLTIKSALKCMKGGDKLFIRSGTYNEFIDGREVPSGTPVKYTLVSGYEGDVVNISPLTGGGGGDAVWFYGQSYITLSGVSIDGSKVQWMGIRFNNESHHIRIEDSEIKDAPFNCIGVMDYTSHHLEFISLKVHGCGYHEIGMGHGIYPRGSDHLIENSEVYGNFGYGIHIFGSKSGLLHRDIVRYNRVYDNWSAGILVGGGRDHVVYNNIVWKNGFDRGHPGIRIGYSGTKHNQAYNNTVYKNAGAGISVEDGANAVVKNNISWKNGKDEVVDKGSGSIISFNSNINPNFVNEDEFDFKLDEASQVIDAGDAIEIVQDDVEGVQRPYNGKYDIGAYEFVSNDESDTKAPHAPKDVTCSTCN